MRAIPAVLASRVRMLAQVAELNSDPKNRMIITRNTVPITDYDMWLTATINAGNPTKTSVAVSRPSSNAGPLVAYVAAIESGTLRLYSATLKGLLPPTVWSLELTIEDTVDVAIAFDGHFVKRRNGMVEFVTAQLWIFYIDSTAAVMGWRLGHLGAEQLATGAVSVSAVKGTESLMGDVSEGLVLAWATTAGDVMTRQYYDGAWADGVLCSAAPAGVTALALSRTWDYRLAMQLRDSSGKVWQMIGRSMISGNANTENITATMDMTTDVYETIPRDMSASAENVQADLSMDTDIYSTIAPTLLSAANINDGSGNWGIKMRLRFNGPVYDLAGNAAAFTLGGTFAGEALAYDPADPDLKTLILTLADFNNAAPSTTLAYTPGSLASGPSVTLLGSQSIAVSLSNLVPSAPPAVLLITSVSNTVIDVQFDGALSSANIAANSAAFAVTGNEPLYSPGGSLVATTYGVSSVAFKDGTSDTVRIMLTTAGRLKHPQGQVTIAYAASSGNLKNAAGTLSVASFSRGFTPTGLTLFFNPHAPENIQATLDMTIDVNQIAYTNSQGTENIQATLGMTVAVYDTNSNPV